MDQEANINTLVERLADLERRLDKSESDEKTALAEASFKIVLDADYHLDDKASRILSAMAFLTAAAGAIFAKAYSPTVADTELRTRVSSALSGFVADPQTRTAAVNAVIPSLQKSAIYIMGWDMSLVSFALYIIFVLISTGFYLAALGPALNKPAFWTSNESGNINSRLFYDLIARVKFDTWKAHWQDQSAEQLRAATEQDYIKESWLLAEKAYAKFLWMSYGSIFFRLALVAFILFIASLFSVDSQVVKMVAVIGVMVLLGVYVFERLTRPPRPVRKQLLRSWLFWVMTFLLVLLLYVPMILLRVKPVWFEILTLLWAVILCAYTGYARAAERSFNDDKWGMVSMFMAIGLCLAGVFVIAYGV
jgi:hypothetical protein